MPKTRVYWQDFARSDEALFHITPVPAKGADVNQITPFGTVMQEGTPQDSAHFNSMDESLWAHEMSIGMLINFVRQNRWEIEHGTVQLTNTSTYPFNNSKKSVALKNRRESSDYIVLVNVLDSKGNYGEIVVSDKLNNGFKIASTGSAKSVIVEYQIIGGFMR